MAALGVDKPIVPGIMPVTNLGQITRMAQMSGAAVPRRIVDRLELCSDPEHVRKIGVEMATQLCRDLIEAGAPGLHLYTLNRATTAKEIVVNLDLITV